MAEAEPEPEMAAATSAAGSRAGSGKSRTMGMSASAPVLQNSPYAATVGKPMRRPKVWVPPPGAPRTRAGETELHALREGRDVAPLSDARVALLRGLYDTVRGGGRYRSPEAEGRTTERETRNRPRKKKYRESSPGTQNSSEYTVLSGRVWVPGIDPGTRGAEEKCACDGDRHVSRGQKLGSASVQGGPWVR